MATTNGTTASTVRYSDRLEAFRKSDAERESMVAEILRNYEALKARYENKCDDYEAEVESRRALQKEAREAKVALSLQKQASGSSNFALIILDGDGAIFRDHLYAQGKDGGAEAAHQLHTEVRDHLRNAYPESNVSDWSIVVQVVLNLQGLCMKLQACGSIGNPNEFVAFGRAFGQAQPLFSFIDAGSGKERADHKLRETLRLFLPNAQCKHVFFGPCHDNGYIPVLDNYRQDYSKLTLIETRPATSAFVQLGLKRIQFPTVFRDDNLPEKPKTIVPPFQGSLPLRTNSMNASSAAFSPQSAISPSPSPALVEDSVAVNSWTAVSKNGLTTKNINIAPKKTPARKHVLVNVYDERLDMPLPDADPGAYKRFSERQKAQGNFCNPYHVAGDCPAGGYCDYQHGERLSPGEQLVLKHKTRTLHCASKYLCRDANCYLGHHCKFGDKCFFENCRFTDTHNMDPEPAKRVYEDGTEEWLPAYLEKHYRN